MSGFVLMQFGYTYDTFYVMNITVESFLVMYYASDLYFYEYSNFVTIRNIRVLYFI